MAHKLDKYIKDTLEERYKAVIQTLEENKEAMEQMTQELLSQEVITGKRVQEIIKENGGKIFEGEDLHTKDEELPQKDDLEENENNESKDEK